MERLPQGKYTPEFRADAVKLLEKEQLSVRQAAKRLSIPALNERFTNLMTPLASGAEGLSAKLNAGSLGGALMLGALLGLVWSPCSGPLLAAALTLVASEGSALRGTHSCFCKCA